MTINTDDAEVKEFPVPPTSTLFSWIKDNFAEVRHEAQRRNMSAADFILLMLDDALEAWQNSEVFAE